MMLDKNILRFTVVDENDNETYVYYDLSVEEERGAAIQTLINQVKTLEEMCIYYDEELEKYHRLEMEN